MFMRSWCTVGPKFVRSWPEVRPKLARSSCEVGAQLARSSSEVGPKFVRSWPEVRPKLVRSSCEVGPKFVRSWFEVRAKLARSFVAKFASKWKHIFCAYRMSVHLQTVEYLSGHLPAPDCRNCLWFPVFRNIGPCARCGAVTRTGSCSTPPTSVGMSSNPSGLSPETPRPKTYVPPHLRQRVTPGTPSPSHSPSSSPHARWYVCWCVGVRMLKLTVFSTLVRL